MLQLHLVSYPVASLSCLYRPATKRNINDWQVSEFIWAYLEGTETTPKYEDIQWEVEAGNNTEPNEGVEDTDLEHRHEDDSTNN